MTAANKISEARICRTADGRLVPEGHPDAAFLAYPVGAEVPGEQVPEYEAYMKAHGQADDDAADDATQEAQDVQDEQNAQDAQAAKDAAELAEQQAKDDAAKAAAKAPNKAATKAPNK